MTGQFKKTAYIIWKITYRTVLIALVFILLMLSAFFVRLSYKPMDLSFLMPQIQKYMFTEKSGLKLEADSVYLSAEMRRSGLFHIQIENMDLIGKDEALILDLPRVELSYGLLPLLTLNYIPTSIRIDEALLQLTLTADGKLLLQGQSAEALSSEEITETKVVEPIVSSSVTPDKAVVVRDVRNFVAKILQFRRLILNRAALVIDDEKTHRRIIVPQLNFTLKRRRFTRYEIEADAKVRIQRDLMTFQTNALYNTLAQTIEFDIFFDQVNLSRAGRVIPLLEGLKVLLQGEINGSLDIAEGSKHWRNAFKSLNFNVKTTQKGTVRLPEPLNTIYPVAEIVADGSFAPNLNTLRIKPIKASLTTGLKADVDIMVTQIGDFLDQNNFNLVKTTMNARLQNIPIKEVPTVWPSYLGPNAHKWVSDNLRKGTATNALFKLDFEGALLADLIGDVDFKEATVDYLSPMKPVQNAAGKVMLYPDKVEIFADQGTINNIRLQTANVYLTDLRENAVSQAKIELEASGPASEILELINEKPLNLLKGMDINPSQVQADVNGQVTLSFPLTQALTPQDVAVNVQASASNASFETADKKIRLTNAQAGLLVTNNDLTLRGTGVYEGLPIEMKWQEFFLPTAQNPLQSVYTVSGTISDSFIKPYFNEISDYLIGNIGSRISYQKFKEQPAKMSVEADLKQAELMLHPVAYTKVAGVPATLKAEVELSKENAFKQVQFDLSADKKALEISGLIEQLPEKIQVDLKKIKAPGSDFSARFSRHEKTKDFSLILKGKSWLMTELKNTPYFKKQEIQLKKETTVPRVANFQIPPAIDVDISLDKVILNMEAPLKNIAVQAKRTGYKWQNLFIFAKGEDAFAVSFAPSTDKIEGLVNNIGDFLNRLNFSGEFSGGTAQLNGIQTENGFLKGEVQVKDLNFKNPGFIMQALTILGVVDAVRGKELNFSRGSIPFELSPLFLLSIQDGVLYGTSLGITFTGESSLDFIKMSGSVIPAYAVNSLPGRIPLIGSLFRTVPNGGLMGVMYELTGTLSSPVVTFNPLSSIAPGILSRLFQ